tara:strand:- start:2 stop:535 length:534 start_codon:yes stop_codon:yes gene_type:complete
MTGKIIDNLGRSSGLVKEVSAGGITVADQWRLTTTYTGTADPMTSNLEQVDTSGQGTLGTAMSESSGVFTFPSTGIYLVRFVVHFQLSGDDRDCQAFIKVTTNDSSYSRITQNSAFIQQTSSSTTYSTNVTETLIDVTDTANVKCSFGTQPNNSSTGTRGETGENRTYMTFVRLGDT